MDAINNNYKGDDGELRTYVKKAEEDLHCPACGQIYLKGKHNVFFHGNIKLPLCTNEFCGAWRSSGGRNVKKLRVALIPNNYYEAKR